jgi:hypothetical protein
MAVPTANAFLALSPRNIALVGTNPDAYIAPGLSELSFITYIGSLPIPFGTWTCEHSKLNTPGVVIRCLKIRGISIFSLAKHIGQNGPSSPSSLFFQRTDSRKGYIDSASISLCSFRFSSFSA